MIISYGPGPKATSCLAATDACVSTVWQIVKNDWHSAREFIWLRWPGSCRTAWYHLRTVLLTEQHCH